MRSSLKQRRKVKCGMRWLFDYFAKFLSFLKWYFIDKRLCFFIICQKVVKKTFRLLYTFVIAWIWNEIWSGCLNMVLRGFRLFYHNSSNFLKNFFKFFKNFQVFQFFQFFFKNSSSLTHYCHVQADLQWFHHLSTMHGFGWPFKWISFYDACTKYMENLL